MPKHLASLGVGGPFTPNQISGLVLWLKSDAGLYQDSGGTTPATADGDPVGLWQDQSGNSKHASQATAGNRPALKLSIINGRPTIRFNGTSQYLSNSDFALGTACSIYVVTSRATGTGYRLVISNEFNFYVGQESSTPPQFASFYGNGSSWVQVTGHGSDSEWYNNYPLILCSINNGNDTASINSAEVDSRASAMAAFSNGYSIARQQSAGAQFWDRDIAEILIYNTAHAAADRDQVLSYLHSRYNQPRYLPALTRYVSNPVVAKGTSGDWEDSDVANPDVFYDTPNNRWVMNYSGYDGSVWKTGLAYSTDLLSWTKEAANPVFAPDGSEGSIAANGSIANKSGTYYLLYQCFKGGVSRICLATSTNLTSWTRASSGNPVLALGSVGEFDVNETFDPMVRLMADGVTFELFYAGSGASGRGIGRATSTDGVTWTKSGRLFAATDAPFSVGGLLGEPAVLYSGTSYALFFDRDGGVNQRRICEGFTADSGSTWAFRRDVLGAGSGWDSQQAFDACPMVSGGIFYLFYAGADTAGAAAGLNAQIGVATCVWPYSTLTG